jgi:hypothetical protein
MRLKKMKGSGPWPEAFRVIAKISSAQRRFFSLPDSPATHLNKRSKIGRQH